MGEEQVSSIGEISRVDAGKDGQDARFEDAGGLLGGIVLVHVQRYKLVSAVPCVCDVALLVVSTGFVVEDNSVDGKMIYC